MYCRKMDAYTKNNKLLIHFFQDTLSEGVVEVVYGAREKSYSELTEFE